MSDIAIEQSLVLSIPVEVLAPGSEYDRRRLSLKSEYDRIIQEAKKVTAINSAEEAENATNLGRVLQAGTKESGIFFTPIKRQIDAFKQPVLEHQNEFEKALDTEKRRLGALLTAWTDRCERERIEAERKAREEAERQAREEQLARAIELDATGDHESAEQLLEEPVFAPAIVQAVAPPKIQGKVSKATYKCLVTDFKELVKAVADGRAPIQCLSANTEFLNQQARSFKEAFSIPGCKLDKNNGTHFRA